MLRIIGLAPHIAPYWRNRTPLLTLETSSIELARQEVGGREKKKKGGDVQLYILPSRKTQCPVYYQSSKVSLSDISTVHRIDIRSTLAKVGGARNQDISIAE